MAPRRHSPGSCRWLRMTDNPCCRRAIATGTERVPSGSTGRWLFLSLSWAFWGCCTIRGQSRPRRSESISMRWSACSSGSWSLQDSGRVFDFGLFRVNFGIPSNRAIFHPTEDIYGYMAYALFALAGIHALAALWHHFIRHDGVLLRGVPRRHPWRPGGGTGSRRAAIRFRFQRPDAAR
jgi:hypothetical protein